VDIPSAAPCHRPALAGDLRVERIAFDSIDRSTWDTLLAVSARPTPFARWTFHRAWWHAYGDTAEPLYLVCSRPGPGGLDDHIVAIVPLMTRPSVPDLAARPRGPSPCSVFMAASYHADYATFLCDPADLPEVAEATACELARHPVDAWDALDLRRLRHDDPLLPAAVAALRAASPSWHVEVSQEDVCPVVTLPDSSEWDDYLATLSRKSRHEIRRKIRRAEAVGPVRFRSLPLDASSVETFIALHQARWGEQGLFANDPSGERSRRFLHRLTELEAMEGSSAQLQLGEVTVGDRVVFASVAFDDGVTVYFYNAGMDPDARDLSPGVTGTAAYLRDRIEAGRRSFDFLRGNEPYKYEWGAADEPIGRILVTRS
jgi:CelD/BcsL family acetyltransferase involved in cellulose biosynthesis